MSNPAAGPVHLDDSDLLALVDDEFTPMERDVRLAHVARCDGCAARLQTLRLRTSNLSRLLADVQLPDDFVFPRMPEPSTVIPITALPPRRTWMHSAWARAAIIALVVIVSFATVAPLRAWVMERWSDVREMLGGRDAAPAPAAPASQPAAPASQPAAPEPQPAGGATVYFTPASGRFVLTVSERQASGTLTLGRAEGSEGTAEVIGGATETPLVSESGIRILNTHGSTASYRVLLPSSVARVRVRVGGGAPIEVTADELARGRVVNLASR